MSRREELMQAAIELFGEKGYHRTTVSDIVGAAGVAQGTFYLYFESKKALFASLLEKFVALIEEKIAEIDLGSEQVSTIEDIAARVKTAIRQVLVVYRDNAVLARIFLGEAMGLEPDFAHVRESIMARLAQGGAAVLEQAVERGILPAQNSLVVAHCVVGMIERIAYYWLFEDNELELEELVGAVARFELLGISGTPSPNIKDVLQSTD